MPINSANIINPSKAKSLIDDKYIISSATDTSRRGFSLRGYSVGLGTTEALIGGSALPFSTYSLPTSAISFTITSTSGSDTGIFLRLTYIDINDDLMMEIVPVNGTVPYQPPFQAKRLITVIIVGGNLNVGTISVVGNGITYLKILPNTGSSQENVFSVPKDYDCYITRVFATTARRADIAINFRIRIAGSNAFFIGERLDLYESGFTDEINPPFKVPPLSDLVITGFSTGPNQSVTAGMDIVLLHTSVLGTQ